MNNHSVIPKVFKEMQELDQAYALGTIELPDIPRNHNVALQFAGMAIRAYVFNKALTEYPEDKAIVTMMASVREVLPETMRHCGAGTSVKQAQEFIENANPQSFVEFARTFLILAKATEEESIDSGDLMRTEINVLLAIANDISTNERRSEET